MLDPDTLDRRSSLEELIEDFKSHADRFPNLRHCIVEAPYERTSNKEPASEFLDQGVMGQRFFDAGPPARMHYYFDAGRKTVGKDLVEFRRLAHRAALIVEGWPEKQPGLPETLDHPIRMTRGCEAETWMVIVHRLAWLCEEGQPLQAEVSVPKGYEPGRTALPPGHPVSWCRAEPRHDDAIPDDCIISTLPDAPLGLACVWAIRMIGKRIDHPEMDCRFPPAGQLEGVIQAIDGILGCCRDLSENAKSTSRPNHLTEMEIRYLIVEMLPGRLGFLRTSGEVRECLRTVWWLEKHLAEIRERMKIIDEHNEATKKDGRQRSRHFRLTREEIQEFGRIRLALSGTGRPGLEVMAATTSGDPIVDQKPGTGSDESGIRSRPPIIDSQAGVERAMGRNGHTAHFLVTQSKLGVLEFEPRGSKFAVWFTDPAQHVAVGLTLARPPKTSRPKPKQAPKA
jgi:hypothetical protein